MSYVIGASCVDVTDRACVDECPVDCIYVGGRMAYVNPTECIDCGACEPVCPVEAIVPESDVAESEQDFIAANAAFFLEVLPGRDEPLGNPGGAGQVGEVGADSYFVRTYEAP
ncbi:4Fe-4S ferredoxin iron-sulfur binding domain-containing protein [Pseudonocardia dioxanivorans CB1190]|uniref:Ferredoxin n=1 Tax=Pseudonocardia dioxanivorans (strain ATCC 55486 / DSM 44775 / JCM 13855 / CB1190) TaxID=675635 RepID=F4D224_PSEUX|nr:ferredoxin [Pseudonocardia dioxanivorans]AEA28084.1 4Fe-4S ferredoxin iron-sulfur binding domain-containing protein [Pseudonocardia dioxanivorans CB1190]